MRRIVSANLFLVTDINVNQRPDNGLYKTAPVAIVMCPIYISYNQTTTINIPHKDEDGYDVRYRLVTNTNEMNEYSDVCPPDSLPLNAMIYPNCMILK